MTDRDRRTQRYIVARFRRLFPRLDGFDCDVYFAHAGADYAPVWAAEHRREALRERARR